MRSEIIRSGWLLLAYLSSLAAIPGHCDPEDALDLFVGHWEIDVVILQPKAAQLNYTEHYERILDGKYIRGETSRKADNTKDVIMGTYDEAADGYAFWVFSSSGSFTYLPPGDWDPRRRVMTWKNPAQFDIAYNSTCRFPTADQRLCYLIVKDWKGKVLSEMKWTAQRR